MSRLRSVRMGRLGGFAVLPCMVVVPCMVALAGCGSTDAPSGTVTDAASPTSSNTSFALQFAKCMRANGVAGFPDPTTHGGAVEIGGSGINPRSPAFQTAQKACRKYLPNGGPPTATAPGERTAAVAFAKCMRDHGEPDFPDPALNPPSAPSPNTFVISLHGMVFVLGSGISPGSPAFRQAASRCGVKLPTAPKAGAP